MIIMLKVTSWVIWGVFLLSCAGAWVFVILEKHDPYFVRHYQHYPMDRLTGLVTAHPIWIAMIPFLWLPSVISYQRKGNPGVRALILLFATMFIGGLTLAITVLFSGIQVQM